jgi:hypothetical protein
MAIKGKSRPKSGGKPVTRGPRPTYVPVKKPLLARRGLWIGVVSVLVIASIVGIWYGIARQRSKDREAALAQRLRVAATKYQGLVDPVLAPIGQSQAPSGFIAFSEFSDALKAFADGSGDAASLTSTASTASDQAKKAAASLDKVDAVAIVSGKGFDENFVLYVVNSKARMVEGLDLYRQAALLAQDAANASGQEADELTARAKDVLGTADKVFGEGYQDYTEARFKAGTFQPTATTGLPGQPVPNGLTGATGG